MNNPQLTELLQELSEQQKQTHRDFDSLKEENGDLYRQVGALRRKHEKQQATVDRLITFMIHFIQQSGTVCINGIFQLSWVFMVFLGPVNTPNRIEKISRAIDANRIGFETFEYRRISRRSSNTATKTVWRNRSAKTFSANFPTFSSVLSKSRHEPNYTKLEKRQGRRSCLKYYF